MHLLVLVTLAAPARASDFEFGFASNIGAGEKPTLVITPTSAVEQLAVSCKAGSRTKTMNAQGLGAGQSLTLAWERDLSVTHADCTIETKFADGRFDLLELPIDYAYGGQLSVDLSKASVDLKERTLTVSVTAAVERAEIVAYGPRRVELDRREVPVRGGPGPVVVPWTGDPSEVVLLDVTLHTTGAWAGFTYSPWFLDIPHEDVLFETNKSVIRPEEEWKLEKTLADLQGVVDKYGDVVPIKLYVGGCTDTVGELAANRKLSTERARAIAAWLKAKGFSYPIHFYGFGESFLAVPTGDGVDEQRNRRAVYYVGSNPPPASAGVPSVGWSPL